MEHFLTSLSPGMVMFWLLGLQTTAMFHPIQEMFSS